MELELLYQSVLEGRLLNKPEALSLISAPLESLVSFADRIRSEICGNNFDICTIVNAKSGACTEDCKYCAQSAHHAAKTATYPLMTPEQLTKEAVSFDQKGMLRFSLVTSGKRLNDSEIDRICESAKSIRQSTSMKVCISGGLLSFSQYCRLKEAGVSRIHNNLESSASFFPNICTTHTYEEKIRSIQAAKKAGLQVCSGGIFGLGETMEDRIDMVLTLRELGVKSIPLNMLNPIPGTPYEDCPTLPHQELKRTVAIYRFLLPDAAIRLAGGRGLLPDQGRACFLAGANAAISGDMLTTSGYSVETDMSLLQELGYQIAYAD